MFTKSLYHSPDLFFCASKSGVREHVFTCTRRLLEYNALMLTSRSLPAIIIAALLIFPFTARAYPFGGQTSIIIPCFNAAIYAVLGGPRGGAYIWTPSTRTYQYGPPTHSGQWLLGLTSVPYICLVWVAPLFVLPGIGIGMMGSSQ